MNIKRKKKKVIVPLSSMSDVAFLLLIFIMLFTLINYRTEVNIDFPRARTALRTSGDRNLEVWIDIEGHIYLNGHPSCLYAFNNKIAELYRTAPDTRIHIIADKNTPYRNINKVLEIMQLLQYRTVSFVVRSHE